MSTPEHPDTPPLTRKQLRELRTGGVPIISVADDVEIEDGDTFVVGTAPPAAAEPVAPVAPLPRPAEPTVVPPAPVPDASVDLGVTPLTRRQARQQEKIRTASVPVITPDFAAQWEADHPADDAESGAGPHGVDAPNEPLVEEPITEAEPVEAEDADVEVAGDVPAPVGAARAAAENAEASEDASPVDESDAVEPGVVEAPRPVVNPIFGAELLAGDGARVELPPTFDQLISREASSAGSIAAPNALILSQTPAAGPLTGPIASTGEVLITGTFDLEGVGSTGHAPGVADGKEVDAVLVDGELPAHSSPTPIAASAAISTVKTDGEIIRPPAPEKGSKLMLTLAITAGALALALVGVLILAFVTGVFA